jgi:RNA polymerase sigma factor (sigma-70 family)
MNEVETRKILTKLNIWKIVTNSSIKFIQGYDFNDFEQIALISLWEHLKSYQNKTKLETFASVVVNNRLKNELSYQCAQKRDIRKTIFIEDIKFSEPSYNFDEEYTKYAINKIYHEMDEIYREVIDYCMDGKVKTTSGLKKKFGNVAINCVEEFRKKLGKIL